MRYILAVIAICLFIGFGLRAYITPPDPALAGKAPGETWETFTNQEGNGSTCNRLINRVVVESIRIENLIVRQHWKIEADGKKHTRTYDENRNEISHEISEPDER